MDKVTGAIEFAAEAHDGMVRKKDRTPYILQSKGSPSAEMVLQPYS